MSTDLTITNADLWNALVGENPQAPGPLAELVALDTPLPASNLLRRSFRLAREAFGDLEESRMALVKKYVTKDEQTGADIAQPEFHEQFAELLKVEVTLAGAVPVKIADLGDIKFSASKLERLSKFVVDE